MIERKYIDDDEKQKKRTKKRQSARADRFCFYLRERESQNGGTLSRKAEEKTEKDKKRETTKEWKEREIRVEKKKGKKHLSDAAYALQKGSYYKTISRLSWSTHTCTRLIFVYLLLKKGNSLQSADTFDGS